MTEISYLNTINSFEKLCISQHQAITAAQQQQNTYGNNQQQFAQQMAAQIQMQNSLLNGGFIDPNAMIFNNTMVENYGYENHKNNHHNGYKNRNNGYYNKNRNYNKNGYEGNNKFRNNHNKNQNYRNNGEGNNFGQGGGPRFKKNHFRGYKIFYFH